MKGMKGCEEGVSVHLKRLSHVTSLHFSVHYHQIFLLNA